MAGVNWSGQQHKRLRQCYRSGMFEIFQRVLSEMKLASPKDATRELFERFVTGAQPCHVSPNVVKKWRERCGEYVRFEKAYGFGMIISSAGNVRHIVPASAFDSAPEPQLVKKTSLGLLPHSTPLYNVALPRECNDRSLRLPVGRLRALRA